MIESFFEPISKTLIKKKNKGIISANIQLNTTSFPSLSGLDVAIIGIGPNADLIRKHLYQYSFQFSGIEIADLGNLKHQNTVANINAGLAECLIILRENNVIPIVIGESMNYSSALLNGVNFSSIDYALVSPYIDLKADSITKQLLKKNKHFHSSFIGTQTFLNTLDSIQECSDHFCENMGLGHTRNNIAETEPLLRQADLFEFDFRAIAHKDFASASESLPNGLTNHEACVICRYAGISNHIGVYLLNNFSLSKENETDQMQAAQMIWYLLNGIDNRFNDHPNIKSRNFIVYKCHGENGEDMLFINSLATGRWWMQVPDKQPQKKKVIKFVGCNEADYDIAKMGEVPEKWYRASVKS
jgi:formiminoglutamase